MCCDPAHCDTQNMYLEWYKNLYSQPLASGSSALDVPHLRRALPAANAVRFVALLWHDSIMESDGLECSSNDASRGYLQAACLDYVDALVQQCIDAGLWVILAARAKYAAGCGLGQEDVWGSATLRQQMISMWRYIAERYKFTDRIAGYEIMSEPRNKGVSQAAVRDFMREGCDAVHEADPRALCIVGPRPYIQLRVHIVHACATCALAHALTTTRAGDACAVRAPGTTSFGS